MSLMFAYDTIVTQEGRSETTGAKPTLTAYETPDWRVPGLAQAWGYANATVDLLSQRYQNLWEGAVVTLHDHKGVLEITWRDHETRMLFEGVMAGAWERTGEPCVEHKRLGRE
jgi:hypothetical protein